MVSLSAWTGVLSGRSRCSLPYDRHGVIDRGCQDNVDEGGRLLRWGQGVCDRMSAMLMLWLPEMKRGVVPLDEVGVPDGQRMTPCVWLTAMRMTLVMSMLWLPDTKRGGVPLDEVGCQWPTNLVYRSAVVLHCCMADEVMSPTTKGPGCGLVLLCCVMMGGMMGMMGVMFVEGEKIDDQEMMNNIRAGRGADLFALFI